MSIIAHATETWTQIIIAVYLAKKDTAVIAKSLKLARHVRKSGVVWQAKSNNALVLVNVVASDQVVVTTTIPKRMGSLISVKVVTVVTAEEPDHSSRLYNNFSSAYWDLISTTPCYDPPGSIFVIRYSQSQHRPSVHRCNCVY